MTFQEWWAGLGRSYDPETIWKAAQRAAVAQAREAMIALDAARQCLDGEDTTRKGGDPA